MVFDSFPQSVTKSLGCGCLRGGEPAERPPDALQIAESDRPFGRGLGQRTKRGDDLGVEHAKLGACETE
jgi:hypothetical protein